LVREILRLSNTAIAGLDAFALGNLRYEVNVSEKRMTLKETEKDMMIQICISWALPNLQPKTLL
jgi:hypothetical protein